MRKLITLVALCGLLSAAPLHAEESLDALLGGFDSGTETAAPVQAEKRLLPENLHGFLKLGAAWNVTPHKTVQGAETTDWQGLSRLRAELQAEYTHTINENWHAFASAKAQYDAAFSLNGRSEYTDDVLDEYESETELREAWLRGSFGKAVDVKLGRQIIVWGKSDNLRITDVLNPMDMREPGVTDIEDQRIPLAMSRVDYYTGDWSFMLAAIHEVTFNKTAVWGHEFYPSGNIAPREEKPSSAPDNTEFAFAANGIFSGWDLSLYAARIWNDTPNLAMRGMSSYRQHRLLHMTGLAANIALGNFLLKTEAAHFTGLGYKATANEDFARTDILLGAEYSGWTDTTVSFEIADRHIHDYTGTLKSSPEMPEEDEITSALRITRKLLNQRLELTALAMTYGATGQNGAIQRVSGKYELMNAVNLTAGAAMYQSGTVRNSRMGNNDRIFAEIRYDF